MFTRMTERETIGLITMLYDYKPSFETITSSNPLPLVVNQVVEYLTKRKYFIKFGEPTQKLYDLLARYDINIEQLQKKEDPAEDPEQKEEIKE